jgi:purine-nucleoside phosphorylase
MSIHISAAPGDIAPFVLLPGDPLRARHVAETYFEDPTCVNQTRGMVGFTGVYGGKPVSIQGTGMGVPSIAIYTTELVREYGVRTLIRVGTCGAFQPDMAIGDVILAQAACTDSNVNQLRFGGRDFSPCADFGLLQGAWQAADDRGLNVRVGPVLTSDSFYQDQDDPWGIWQRHGVLAIEMESTALYTIAAAHGVRALSILTVSDQIVTGEKASSEQRQTAFMQMVELALSLA